VSWLAGWLGEPGGSAAGGTWLAGWLGAPGGQGAPAAHRRTGGAPAPGKPLQDPEWGSSTPKLKWLYKNPLGKSSKGNKTWFEILWHEIPRFHAHAPQGPRLPKYEIEKLDISCSAFSSKCWRPHRPDAPIWKTSKYPCYWNLKRFLQNLWDSMPYFIRSSQ